MSHRWQYFDRMFRKAGARCTVPAHTGFTRREWRVHLMLHELCHATAFGVQAKLPGVQQTEEIARVFVRLPEGQAYREELTHSGASLRVLDALGLPVPWKRVARMLQTSETVLRERSESSKAKSIARRVLQQVREYERVHCLSDPPE